MPYGNDISVYVEDVAGDLGAPETGVWWLSPDVDIPAHSGEATQGSNDVQIRVHCHDEPILTEKIVAEVYVGIPSLAMSPTVGTKRIDPGNIVFRPAGVPGTEPVADVPGGTVTFPWTPSSVPGDVDGPGHRCLVVRAFPESVAPPIAPFDVAAESHEAQHNIEILTTTMAQGSMRKPGAGTRRDPRRRDARTGLWSERLATVAAGPAGTRVVAVAFDPKPEQDLPRGVVHALEHAKIRFSREPPAEVGLAPVRTRGETIDPRRLVANERFAERSGVGQGQFAESRLEAAAVIELSPDELDAALVRFDHSNLPDRSAAVLHVAQWSEAGQPEGGMTIVALAPSPA